MPEDERLIARWTLRVEAEDPSTLEQALAPESEGHHALEIEDGALVASGEDDVGGALHSIDDLLACLTAAVQSLEQL